VTRSTGFCLLSAQFRHFCSVWAQLLPGKYFQYLFCSLWAHSLDRNCHISVQNSSMLPPSQGPIRQVERANAMMLKPLFNSVFLSRCQSLCAQLRWFCFCTRARGTFLTAWLRTFKEKPLENIPMGKQTQSVELISIKRVCLYPHVCAARI
jgi:hypothetical protein